LIAFENFVLNSVLAAQLTISIKLDRSS